MREQLKKIAHSNRFFEVILNFERKIQYYYIPVAQFNKGKKKRISGKNLKDNPYCNLKTLKDTFLIYLINLFLRVKIFHTKLIIITKNMKPFFIKFLKTLT